MSELGSPDTLVGGGGGGGGGVRGERTGQPRLTRGWVVRASTVAA